MKVFSLVPLSVLIVSVLAAQNEYQSPNDEQRDKIIGLKHFEEFLRDLELKIAEWTRRFRDTVVVDNNNNNNAMGHQLVSRQADPASGPGEAGSALPVSDWLVVKDIIEGAKFARKQISDFIDRMTRVITGDQTTALLFRQSSSSSNLSAQGPYVPVVKELREFLVLLQKRMTVWSTELERIFSRPPSDYPALI